MKKIKKKKKKNRKTQQLNVNSLFHKLYCDIQSASIRHKLHIVAAFISDSFVVFAQ